MSTGARQARTSGRVRQWSNKIKALGKEAREEARQRRIGQLESDNYVEDQQTHRATADDEDYVDHGGSGSDSDFEGGGGGGGGHGDKKTSGGGGGMKKKIKGRTVATAAAKAKRFRSPMMKSFQLAVEAEGYDRYPSYIPTYLSILASPSSFPSRHFCFVCGNNSQYECPNCGLRFCKIRCNDEHKESRCLKFLA